MFPPMLRPFTFVLVVLSLTGAAVAGALAFPGSSPIEAAAPPLDDDAGGHGAHAHPESWSAEQVEVLRARTGEGEVPTLVDALKLKRIPSIRIAGDAGFTPANGVLLGAGTLEDPFVIEGVYADVLHLSDTDAFFELRNSYIASTLVLDWTNLGGFVHHNFIKDLRVNRNVERTGMPTAAVIAANEIGQIGQLRHFDGVLVGNTIGDKNAPAFGQHVFLLDGYNGAAILNNTVYGSTEMKLHGHHHSGMHGASHNHAMADAEDHGERHHSLLVMGNRFVDPFGKGLRVHDRDHAGDDRTATSETNPELVGNHTHWSTLVLSGNRFEGKGLFVDVFNAPDDYHQDVYRGTLLIEGNRFTDLTESAIRLGDVANGDVTVRDNVAAASPLSARIAGLDAYRLAGASLLVEDNRFEGMYYGVKAREFDDATFWNVVDLAAPGAAYPVYYDESVANRPGGVAHEGHPHPEGSDAAPRESPGVAAASLVPRL